MITKLLINRDEEKIAARLFEHDYGKKELIIIDERIKNILRICGINVPRDFTPDRSCHVHLDHPDENLFAIAFEKYFYPHGLMQGGYYWITEEDYAKQPTKLEVLNYIFSLAKY